ncbi:hypothetical protein RhiirA5_408884 [Rhizophagus irregularis]|uniref:Uncharacterized protein n=1 Tax=Rhizophagus irregularis TaxID=588596 RepID=A0A2I1EK89_9GLOM|nr:hypothetical protein RhiirA5_408884 [Rhizophagus irregularis]PKC70943.1 hypothetical protein RhiirA1_454119 [Rhizophagus irregularis]PKY22548.1 hypothetical protein RhiirB3_436552 [Rhizophagus irregularis]
MTNNHPSTMNPHDVMSRESRDPFNVAQLSILSYLKFYHFSPNDNNFYLVTCTIIPQDSSFDDQVENILNGFRGLEFDFESLSIYQKLNLEQTLKQKLKKLFCQHYDRNATFHDNIGNHLITTQPVPMANIQNYNNDSITQHGLGDTYYNTTNTTAAHPQQQIDFNNFSYNFTNRSI